ncbi:sensor histidine kinase [Rhabdothermincola sp.]|uniref:sensor histidine kinase n=1 Tax=Rhabdothermincola sp. TaxID=2820405 RepID=UPI002FE033B2
MTAPSLPRRARAAVRLPGWLGSIRTRIALVYSTILFGIAALVVGIIYLGLAHSLDDQPITRKVGDGVVVTADGRAFRFPIEQVDSYLYIEREANARALATLRQYSFGTLLILFASSVAIGWIVAGRVLKPIDDITAVAEEIQATDLSRRINLDGPDDELKHLADTFDDMLARIDQAFESQRQFIHEASHELRNPLAVIRTNLDVTLSDPDATAEDLRRTAEVVQRSTERMARLVDDLLVYARQGSLSLAHERLDIAEVVATSASEFDALAAERGVRLASAAPGGLWVDGDRLALQQALANLLANALAVSPPGSTVRVTAGREGPWVWMAVSDEGPGIAPEDHERVFQRFWRGDPRAGREEGHSGLGLTIVRQVAEAHGGQVRLASEPGRGAAFALWLPAAG